MSEIERFDINPTYTNIITHNNTVYLSGQVPWKTAGEDIALQVNEVFEQIRDHLKTAGTDLTKILSMQVFLKNPSDYSVFNKVFLEWIPVGCAPTRNTICGIQFPNPHWSIEIVVVAAGNIKCHI